MSYTNQNALTQLLNTAERTHDAELNIFVSTGRGCENALRDDIVEVCNSLSVPYKISATQGSTGVKLRGNTSTVMALNMGLTTASRVFWVLTEFKATSSEELYTNILAIPWNKLFSVDKTFAVYANCEYSFANNSMAIALKTKDAIADCFTNQFGRRPNVDTRSPNVSINILLQKDYVTVSLDTSGDSLTDHGYRKQTITAPIRENVAAALLRYSGWTQLINAIYSDAEPQFFERVNATSPGSLPKKVIPKQTLLLPFLFDPMCGSGTLGIEAFLVLAQKKPNALKENFGFKNIFPFDTEFASEKFYKLQTHLVSLEKNTKEIVASCQKYLNKCKEIADIPRDYPPFIQLQDHDFKAIRATKANIANLKTDNLLTINQEDAFTGAAPVARGFLISNPPYSEQLSLDNKDEFYKTLGNVLKKQYGGWQAWIITEHSLTKSIGLRPTSKISIYNGQISCNFSQFIIF